MTLAELLRACPPRRLHGDGSTQVRGLCHDSRRIAPGDLFFALAGAKTDGNRHAKEAVQAGAVAVVSELEPPPPPVSLKAAWVQVDDAALAMGRLADRFFSHPSGALTLVGVTGTNGKTTTTYFLESIFSACGKVPAVAGTVNYRLAGRELQAAVNTTPVSLELLRLLAAFRDGGATHAAMEVSSHALALKRVEEIDFDAAVFTNLTRDHLDFHKTLDAYFEAKARLFELLCKPGSVKARRLAALNADDPKTEALTRRMTGAKTILFGLGQAARDLRAINLELTASGTRFVIEWRGQRLQAQVRLAGEHNVMNALAAAAAALGLGLPSDGVLEGLAALARVPGRLEAVDEGQSFSVFVDYAHTDSALETVLRYLKRLPHARLLTVFGCGGERDRSKRGPMGVAACAGSDFAFITSDNPRGEDPARILEDIQAGLKSAGLKNYTMIPDRAAAIAEAVSQAAEGDIVLIAGKGHETVQIFSDRIVPFDDREAARAALRRRAGQR